MTAATRLIAFALLATLAIHTQLHRVSAMNERLAEPLGSLEIASAIPDGRVLRLLALGHDEAMADLIWINALSFYGRYFHLDTDVSWLDPHIEAIVELDPHFRLVFEWAGAVIMYGGEINNESVMAANRFLELGVERFPLDWSLHFMLGVNYAYELVPETPAEFEQVDEWRAYGAEQIVIAAGLPNAPPHLDLTAASLLRRRADWDRQIGVYETSYLSVGADQARSMRRHIETTMLPADAERLVRARHLVNVVRMRPMWGLQPVDFLLALHPDPVHLFEPGELTPPTLGMTR